MFIEKPFNVGDWVEVIKGTARAEVGQRYRVSRVSNANTLQLATPEGDTSWISIDRVMRSEDEEAVSNITVEYMEQERPIKSVRAEGANRDAALLTGIELSILSRTFGSYHEMRFQSLTDAEEFFSECLAYIHQQMGPL